MAAENERIQEVIRKLEKSILEDGKVDRAEALILLSFAKPKAVGNAEMAEFVRSLEDVLEDGVVTPEESVRIGAHLKWLARETAPAQPDVGFLGKLFKLGTNRTTVRTEIVAGVSERSCSLAIFTLMELNSFRNRVQQSTCPQTPMPP